MCFQVPGEGGREIGLAKSMKGCGYPQKCRVLSSHLNCLCLSLALLTLLWLAVSRVRKQRASVDRAGVLLIGKETLRRSWVRKPGVQESVWGEEATVKPPVLMFTSCLPRMWSESIKPVSQLMEQVKSSQGHSSVVCCPSAPMW